MEDKLLLKQKLIAYCISRKEESEKNLKEGMEEAQQTANEYGAPKDRYDSYRAQQMRKKDMLAEQFAVIQEELRVLRQLSVNIKKQDDVALGALVITQEQRLFIAVGMGKINMDGNIYYAISPVVPVVNAMKGKKAGEEFVFNGIKKKILDIY